MRIETQVAYILHKRPYRDTSQILDVFTRNHGRFSLLSKGSRSPKSRMSGLLQMFKPLVLSWSGRGELGYLNRAETADIKSPRLVNGISLKSAMYVNELLVYMLHKHDIHEDVFDHYHNCLSSLNDVENIESNLRMFEKQLLQCLGFGLNLTIDADSGEPVVRESSYVYHFEHGPVLHTKGQMILSNPVLSGDSLIAFNANHLATEQHYSEIKFLMRYILDGHLGQRRLKSRALFRPQRKSIVLSS